MVWGGRQMEGGRPLQFLLCWRTHTHTNTRSLSSLHVLSSLRSIVQPIVALLALTFPELSGILQSNDISRPFTVVFRLEEPERALYLVT